MKKIKLTNGQFTLVDDDMYEYLKQWNWGVDKNTGYVRIVKWIKGGKGKQITIYMHRLILGVSGGKVADHVNRDKLDNRRVNLRICTQRQNCMNQAGSKNGSSEFKGVGFFKRDKNWHAQIMVNRKQIHIGYFGSEIDAAKAYNDKAKEYFGEFAYLNQI